MSSRSKDLLLYVGIGLLAVVAMTVVAIYLPERYLPNKPWAAFTWFTGFLFIFLAKLYWKVRKPKKFWVLLILILAAHIAVFAPFLQYVQPAFWYVLIMPIEGMLIMLAIKLAFNIMPDRGVRL